MAFSKLLKKSLTSLADVRKQQPEAWRENRPLSQTESQFLSYVLAHGSDDARSFLGQIQTTRVLSRCRCGCPTIGLEISGEPEPGHSDERVIVDLPGLIPEGKQVGVLAFADKGFLSELEIYALDEIPHPFSLPITRSLHSFESSTAKT